MKDLVCVVADRQIAATLEELTALPGAAVKVSMEISATVEDGVSASVQRIVNENCMALKFRSNEHERSEAASDASRRPHALEELSAQVSS